MSSLTSDVVLAGIADSAAPWCSVMDSSAGCWLGIGLMLAGVASINPCCNVSALSDLGSMSILAVTIWETLFWRGVVTSPSSSDSIAGSLPEKTSVSLNPTFSKEPDLPAAILHGL